MVLSFFSYDRVKHKMDQLGNQEMKRGQKKRITSNQVGFYICNELISI